MNFIKRLTEFQTRYPKKVLLIFFIITLLLAPGIFKLIDNLEPSLEKVLPPDIEEIQTLNLMRSEFGVDMVYLLAFVENPLEDIRDYNYLTYIDRLSNKIKEDNFIENVDNLANVVKKSNNGIIPNSENQIRNLIEINPQSSQFVNLASDYSFSIIKIQTTTGSNAKTIDESLSLIEEHIKNLESENPGVKVQITGQTAIDRATFSTILSDFGIITLVSMVVIGFIVFLTFGSLLKGMLPMIVVMNALVWTMGIVGYLGLTLTVISMVAAAMIMGLGIDFGIHQVHSYFEFKKKFRAKKSIEKMVNELIKATIGASLTTMAGFLALLFGVLPAMQTLGIILALGIFTTLIGAVFLLPSIIYLYDIKIVSPQIRKNLKEN